MVPQRAVAGGLIVKLIQGSTTFLHYPQLILVKQAAIVPDTSSPSNDSFGNEPKDKALILKHID